MPTRDTRVVDSRSGTVEQESASTRAVDAAEAPNGRRPELPALLDLPSDVPPAAAGQRRIALARRRLSTMRPDEATLIAALAAVLARYTRQGDLVITHAEAAEAAADGLRFAPVELILGDDASFEALSRQVSAQLEESAGLRSVDDLAPAGGAADDGRSPLTQVLFLREPVDSADRVPFDLALGLDPDGETAALSYDSGVFTAGAAERLLGHLDVMLDAGRAAPQNPIWEVPLLTDAERRQLLADWNATEAAYPDCRVEQLIARQAAATPDQVAVRHDADELTYVELDRRANQLAHRLQRLGVGPDVPVGVCVERSLDMVVALLAVWKAGGAYVPIDPAFPAERQRFMFEDAGLLALLTQESLLRDVPIPDERVICLDRDRPALESESSGAPEHDGEPEHLAYVIYTSGSTGKPKGVQVPHRALANFLTTMAERPGFASDDVLVAVTTLSFDIAGLELYLPLTRGGRVVLASRETASDPRALATLIAESEATVVQATPTTWKMLVDGGWPGRPGLKVLCGGEALPRALAEQLLERDVELWNMYGPTETTIWSTIRRITSLDEPLSIGRPIGNTTLYILDERFQPVPVGIPGELCIGGDGLARGYYNRPDLTAERFPPHPFDLVSGARVYRTGDLARYLPDGNVEFLGRLDHQVKVRGFRIELGEVEYALARHPGVSAAVATTREDAPGDVRLVAYVIPAEGAVSGTELRRFVAEFLPAYMVPSQIVALEAFPTTPNGKIDRKALPVPTGEREIDPDKVVGPRSELERKLVRIWEDVLGVHPIGVQDDFFELGATSILAAQVFARIEHELGAKLPLAPVFQAPTIEQLVGLIENGRGGPRWTSLVPMQPQGTRPPIFCVHGGAGTILHLQPLVRRLGPDQPFYGLQMRGLNGHVGPHRTIEEMSVHYLSELRMVQPHGPYFLAGYCFGGIVAFDIAQRLLAEGEDVATLVMFNSPSPSWLRRYGGIGGQPSRAGSRTPPPPPPRPLGQRILGVLTSAAKIRHYLGYAKFLFTSRYVDPLLFETCARLDLPLPEKKRDDLFLRICGRLEQRYQEHPYPGEIVIFYGDGLYDDPKLGWGDVAEVVSHMVPGKHTRGNRESMAEPKVAFIGEHLQQHLATVHARTASASSAVKQPVP